MAHRGLGFPVLASAFQFGKKKENIYIKKELLSQICMLFSPEGQRGMAGEPANCDLGIRQTQHGNS